MTDVTLRVEPQGLMPKIGVWMSLGSPMTSIRYKFLPKRITNIRWHPDGAVIIDIVGTKQAWNPDKHETKEADPIDPRD